MSPVPVPDSTREARFPLISPNLRSPPLGTASDRSGASEKREEGGDVALKKLFRTLDMPIY
jgi:hypothetical protein